MLSAEAIFEKIYAGILGKAIGVRLGAPVEPTIWSYERIRDTYGEITGYVRDFKNFAADDDTNGPLYFIRALRDYGLGCTAEEVGKTWMNYAAEAHGFYWWGGYGVSTEHTAYLNMKAGIPAPLSGSIATNGKTVAEQIGGQIFIDSWGWVNPENPSKAAQMSAMAASVAHDGEGLEGARFCAAAIAEAFRATSIEACIAAGLASLTEGSLYGQVAKAVLAHHAAHPQDWRSCRELLTRDWGYDRYPGVCHMIPNAGVLVMALIYGEGDLGRTVEIATMAGWDTDCNAGNAGAIVGTLQGLQPSWDKYRGPINDMFVASGVIGTLNVVDVPSFARELAALALALRGQDVPALWQDDMTRRGVRFDFALPGSTHGWRSEGTNKMPLRAGPKGAEVLLDRLERGEGGRVFWKPFYRRSDFDDERYRPMFSPLAASGQVVRLQIAFDSLEGDGNLRICPYVRLSHSQTLMELGAFEPAQGSLTFTLPDSLEPFDEIGVQVEYFGRLKCLGTLHITGFEISGAGRTEIDPALEAEEWGAISRFTWNRGHWSLQDGRIHAHTAEDADLWTGHYYARDLTLTADLRPLAGQSHLICARVQGTSRFYAAGFEGEDLVILKEDFGTTVLARKPFGRVLGQDYALSLQVRGAQLCLLLNGEAQLHAEDSSFAYGQAGLRMAGPGRMSVGRMSLIEEEQDGTDHA